MRISSRFLIYGFIALPIALYLMISGSGFIGGQGIALLFLTGFISIVLGIFWPEKSSQGEIANSGRDLKITLCDQIGKSIHKQMTDALKVNGKAFADPREAVFFYAYLDQLVFSHAEYELSDTLWLIADDYNYKKHICDGVLPKRAWEIYTKGHDMSELADVADFDVEAILEMGKAAGWADAKDGLGRYDRLKRYLIGQDLELGLD